MLFSGTEGNLIIDSDGWEVIPEPKKKSLEPIKKSAGPDSRPAHVGDFLGCVRSRREPVENLEVGHPVSTVAHLGNIALLAGSEIRWDAEKERVIGNSEAYNSKAAMENGIQSVTKNAEPAAVVDLTV